MIHELLRRAEALLYQLKHGDIHTISALGDLKKIQGTLQSELDSDGDETLAEIADCCFHIIEHLQERFQAVNDAVFGLEDAVKMFDGKARRADPRPFRLSDRLKTAILANSTQEELDDLRKRFGPAFNAADWSWDGITIVSAKPKDGDES